jgi:hypothetical protein
MKTRAAWLAVAVVATASPAAAQRHHAVRRRFEPTDFRLSPPGTAEIDLQAGVVEGTTSTRAYAPDVEATLGLSRSAELEIDTQLGFDSGEYQFADQLWVAGRLGVADRDADDDESSWAAGVQAGPRIPAVLGSRGLGVEGLAIVGRNQGAVHLFGQGGFILDSSFEGHRPYGGEGGFDAEIDLDRHDTWTLKGEIGGVHFFSQNADQLHVTAGAGVRPSAWLELTAVGLVGLLPGGDRFGVLFGAAPRFRLF